MMYFLMHNIAVCLFSFDITKHNAFNDRRSMKTEWRLRYSITKQKNNPLYCKAFNLRHYSVVNDLYPSSRYLINCISNTRGRSQTETSTSSICVPHINAIMNHKNMWIILPEVHYCTVEQVSHF